MFGTDQKFFIAEDFGLPWGFVPIGDLGPACYMVKPIHEPETVDAMKKEFQRGIYLPLVKVRA